VAGTVTVSEVRFGSVQKISFSWLSDAAGAADAVTTHSYSGEIARLVTVPSGGGTAPTALYDVRVLDSDGVDVLMGAGVDRSATATEQVLASSLGIIAATTLTLAVTSAGNAKAGVTRVYIKR
jgi:hypothetical protein